MAAQEQPDTGWYRTESGVVLQMDHPLHDGIAQRVASGAIVRVANAHGDRYEPDAPAPSEATDRELLARVTAERDAAVTRSAELERERDERLTLDESSALARKVDELTAELETVRAELAAATAAQPAPEPTDDPPPAKPSGSGRQSGGRGGSR
ncbi:MAG TPA: hypothetical protein VEB59_07505 [Gemmatimonadales bacterium]|nr:hypothetical protein [Gemmatimonadales bacterium]